jgi:hypothetical protein
MYYILLHKHNTIFNLSNDGRNISFLLLTGDCLSNYSCPIPLEDKMTLISVKNLFATAVEQLKNLC